jgi:uncharacterized membrane protein HdeD (DUF308 family)
VAVRGSAKYGCSTEVALADLGDAGEILAYLVGFWAFLFSPAYRARTLNTWRHADRAQRGWMVLDGVVATLVGLGLPLLIVWLLAKELLAR